MDIEPEPLFGDRMQYCIRCCIPETEEGTNFDELGMCQHCRSTEEKMHIDWTERRKELERILQEAKEEAGDNYDCIIPISGGKDSTFQLHVLCNVYDMNPLAVTFNHNWYSETGWYNLINAIETFNVDHMMFTPNRDLVGRLAKRSLHMIGDSCWHCHMGVGSFPLHVAAKFEIPLLVYGEPAQETHGRASWCNPKSYDREYFLEVSARKKPEEMTNEEITIDELPMFQLPTQQELDDVGVTGIHLGQYIFWDDERQMEFIRDMYDWKETEMENTYKRYKSAECIMPGMHDFTCYLKRGYGRATTQASIDVRNGLLTREEGFELVRRHDAERPEALDYFLEITGMTEEEVFEVMGKHRKEPIKDMELPIKEKEEPNEETIRPVFQQWIEKVQGGRRPGLAGLRPPKKRPTPKDQIASFVNLAIGDIHQGYMDGAFTPVDIAELCIERLKELENRLAAWVTWDPEFLLERAEKATERIQSGGIYRLLEGIPVGIKDIMNTKDFPTQMGSPQWEGWTPGNDARVVYNVEREGALLAGKTATAEFAVHALLGKTINPHDPSRTPGTSSTGSAVAVAAGMVPVALGTQTAASIVRPASYNGIYGCKPSFGAVPRKAVLKTTDTLDTIGFFVTYAEDLQRIFDAVRVHGKDYPKLHEAMTDESRQAAPTARPWRVALARTHAWEHAHGYAQTALLDWADRMNASDRIDVVEVDLPEAMEQAHDIHQTIYDKTLSYYFQEEKMKPDDVSPTMQDIFERGDAIEPATFHDALKEQARLAKAMDGFLQDYDALISLSTAGAAPRREAREPPDPGLMWTLTYLPVVSVPVFTSPEGMPFGAQIAARRYNDPLLFKFVRSLEEAGLVPEGPNPALDL